MLRFDSEILMPIMVFAIPIVAITGGIISGIVRSLGRQRLVEIAARERIAAIERGLDPAKLPPLPIAETDDDLLSRYHPGAPKRRAQGLMVGGIITLFAGAGISMFLLLIKPDNDQAVWGVGLIPAFVGAGLLLSAWLVWPRGEQK
jgi:hypothetical protein